jgi:hypothetical protein
MTDQPESRAITVRPSVGGAVAPLVPQSFEEFWRLAQAFAASGMTPKDIKTPEQVMMVIAGGAEVGMGPFQSLQSFAVINGRLSMWGDAVPAILRREGFKIKEWYTDQTPDYGDKMTAHCEVTRPDGDVIVASFSVAQAKKAGLWGKQGPWQQYPDRMLKMRARSFAARDGAADVLRGIAVREEMEDAEVTMANEPAKPQPLEADGPERGPRQPRKKAEAPKPEPEQQAAQANCPHCGVGDGEAHEEGCPMEVKHEEDLNEEDGLDDDADAEGLAGVSAAQDALDAEDGFPPEMKAFIDSVESATTFGQVKGALQTFFATKVFRDMPLAQQNRMRGDTWDAIAEKKEEGQMLDLPDHAQDVSAFRLWIEAQPDHEAIAGTFNVLKTTPNYAGKDDTFKANFQKAVDARIALLTGT